jgi:gliding motility-associated-like protein
MKKLLFLVLLLSNFFGYAQYTLIPDVNFEQALIDLGIDSGAIDGKVLTANISTITSLDVSSKNITNLTGIQGFLALTNLNCFNNQLTNLDVTKNTSLYYLSCWNNQLTSLDVTKNISLTYLDCNANKLTSINVTLNTALTNLFCNDNNLTSFNVTLNTALTNLACSSNQLTSLDVTKNTSLTYLSCFSNQLISLNVIKNTSLTYLVCSKNQLTSLDVTKNTELTELYCTSNQLTDLDVTKNTSLNALTCWNNQLTSLDVSKNTSLNLLYCDNNQLTSLDVSKNTSLTDFACSNNQLTSLNLKNGNNTNFLTYNLNLTSNPNLTCIQVDNTTYSNTNWSSYKDASASYAENCNKTTSNTAPILTATGNQSYCPGTSLKIVTDVSITNSDITDTGTEAIYIQISSGYVNGQDLIQLANPTLHPTIISSWDAPSGKLKLSNPTGADVLYSDFVKAIKDVEFSNSSASPSGIRNFSITIGQANYLPRNGHYYLYVPNLGISWTAAKTAAEASTYYGLQGYLATITAADEAKISGEQAAGAGWIGGSDAQTEGAWKWDTGPEAGTIMSYTKWNTGEPNNLNNEDYAHITAPGVGISGSWNDLSNSGDASGNYQPKGYIVEYGGMPGDPTLEIATSTTITILQITSTTPSSICDSGIITLQATASGETVNWYDSASGGTLLATGNTYTTPFLTNSTTYYVDAGCTTLRNAVTATINTIPTITATNSPVSRCGAGTVTLKATASTGNINWYSSLTGSTIIGTGTSLTVPNVTQNTTYYAEAINNGCVSPNRIPVDIIIYTPPAVMDQEVTLCKSSTVILDAQIPNMTYLWSTGETTETITVSISGVYTVDVTSPSPESCTSRKKITVIEHSIPEIDRIDVNGTTVVIYLTKSEDYFEYSVDGINYQSSNVFFNVSSGLQTTYVREVNFCGADSKTFVVLIAPKFFTPNNDTYNDFWEIKGLINYPEAVVTIFDRYGKLITQLNASKPNWDGTFNKNLLPASDYWYVLKIDNIRPVMKGHFSLKR